jgi:hypothetical protein
MAACGKSSKLHNANTFPLSNYLSILYILLLTVRQAASTQYTNVFIFLVLLYEERANKAQEHPLPPKSIWSILPCLHLPSSRLFQYTKAFISHSVFKGNFSRLTECTICLKQECMTPTFMIFGLIIHEFFPFHVLHVLSSIILLWHMP